MILGIRAPAPSSFCSAVRRGPLSWIGWRHQSGREVKVRVELGPVSLGVR
jgi:hypothetical protein